MVETHRLSPVFVETACHLLSALCQYQRCALMIGQRGTAMLMNTWRDSAEASAVVGPVCNALCSVSIVEENMRLMQTAEFYHVTRDGLQRFRNDAATLQQLCSFLWILAMDDDLLVQIVNDGIALAVVDAMYRHQDSEGVIVATSLVLSTLFEDERCSDQIVRSNKHGSNAASSTNDSNTGGSNPPPIAIIMSTFEQYTQSPLVIEAMVKMLRSMVQHSDLREILTPCSVVEGLIGLEDEHRYRPTIKSLCTETLNLLTNGCA